MERRWSSAFERSLRNYGDEPEFAGNQQDERSRLVSGRLDILNDKCLGVDQRVNTVAKMLDMSKGSTQDKLNALEDEYLELKRVVERQDAVIERLQHECQKFETEVLPVVARTARQQLLDSLLDEAEVKFFREQRDRIKLVELDLEKFQSETFTQVMQAVQRAVEDEVNARLGEVCRGISENVMERLRVIETKSTQVLESEIPNMVSRLVGNAREQLITDVDRRIKEAVTDMNKNVGKRQERSFHEYEERLGKVDNALGKMKLYVHEEAMKLKSQLGEVEGHVSKLEQATVRYRKEEELLEHNYKKDIAAARSAIDQKLNVLQSSIEDLHSRVLRRNPQQSASSSTLYEQLAFNA